jgi:hypothetical protein
MAVFQLESLVLRGVLDACNVVISLERNGSMQADGRAPATPLSTSRHLPGSYPGADMDPGTREGHAENLGAALAAPRAGRPGCSAGVPVSRSPAITAGRAILSGWPRSERGVCATARRQRSFTSLAPASAGKVLSGHPRAFPRRPKLVVRQALRLPAAGELCQRGRAAAA